MSSAPASPNLGSTYAAGLTTEVLSVALIGPHQKMRSAVAEALAEAHRTAVREFDSYPPAADHLQRLFGTFDLIVLDGDSDPELAAHLVEEIRGGDRASVMVYSEKPDRERAASFLRAGAREYLTLPLAPGGMSEALERATTLRPTLVPAERPQGKLLVFAGSKGGSGVTTVACNMAMALARTSEKSTLLIDLALPIGDAALCLGVTAECSTEDALREVNQLDAKLLEQLLVRHPSGLLLLAAPSRVPEVEASQAAIEKLIAVARRRFDHVVVDVGSRIDVAGKALFEVASTIYLVTQTGISELRNSNRVISQFFSERGSNLEIVVNRMDARAPEAENEEIIARALGRPVQWKIPDDQGAAGASGLLESPLAVVSLEMAGAVSGSPAPPPRRGSSEPIAYGRNIAQVNSQATDPSNASTLAPPGRRAAPAVTWPTPGPISYGEKLSAAQLNATASVPGKFVYTPGPGYVLPTGTHTLWVTFTPAESWEDPLQVAVSIVVTKATPELTWPSPPEIARGEPLDEKYLNAWSPVPGKFDYSPGPGEVLQPGTHTLSVTFTPADQANYTSAQATRTITVTRATPAVHWPPLEAIPYGTQLGAKELCASSPVAGRFEYTPGPGAVLAAGEHPLLALFTPADDAGYTTAIIRGKLTVSKATPQMQWSEPAPMTQGSALGTEQLNATANMPGSFAYMPAAGEVLSPGMHKLTVTFTPADTLNYNVARAVVSVSVAEKLPVDLNWRGPSAISYGTALSAAQLNATASVAGAFVYAPPTGIVLPPGRHRLTVSFVPADAERYSTANATVELEVKGLSEITSSPAGTSHTPSPRISTPSHSAPAPAQPEGLDARTTGEKAPRETRTYKGAVYEKGDDGQWHLQKK